MQLPQLQQPKSTLTFAPSKPSSSSTFSNSDFLLAITHELKTPLNAIISFSEALEQDVKDPKLTETCADYAKEINRAAIEMNEIVHDLLDVGQVSSGNFSVDLSAEINVCDAIKRAVRLNKDYALKRNISLKAEISDNIQPIKLDSKRMKQVMTNLISNAIKYSPEKSEVRIFCTQNQTSLEIEVSDHGFGMAPDQIEIAFQKYKTILNPNSGRVDSFGLGLSITKQLVELQGGTIEVKSKINEGTRIILRFQYV